MFGNFLPGIDLGFFFKVSNVFINKANFKS